MIGIRDIDRLILSELNIFDLVRIKQVCKYLNSLCNEEFYKKLFYERFPESVDKILKQISEETSRGNVVSDRMWEYLLLRKTLQNLENILYKNTYIIEYENLDVNKIKWTDYIFVEFTVPRFWCFQWLYK